MQRDQVDDREGRGHGRQAEQQGHHGGDKAAEDDEHHDQGYGQGRGVGAFDVLNRDAGQGIVDSRCPGEEGPRRAGRVLAGKQRAEGAHLALHVVGIVTEPDGNVGCAPVRAGAPGHDGGDVGKAARGRQRRGFRAGTRAR